VFELGAGDAVVGRTDFCVRPDPGVDTVATVGGTKNPDVDGVIELAPDLVLASLEENTRRRVERIAEHVPVLMAAPRGPGDAPRLWRELGLAVGRGGAGDVLAREVELELQRCEEPPPEAGPSFVYWIWRGPWMAAGRDTYISELLTTAGWRNAVPGDGTRYPKLEPSHAIALRPDVLMFSSEPYDFDLPRDLDAFCDAPEQLDRGWSLDGRTVALAVDGQRLSWYPSLTAAGLRLARGLKEAW
jgi:ABC-type Fe3+-hydroxamate transport system substrate-binding protein